MKKYIYIGAGGFIGAVTRYMAKNIHFVSYHGSFPLNTFIINISGSLVIGIILTLAFEAAVINEDARLGIATGFLGAYTTFSTFCKESVLLINKGNVITAFSYTVLSIAAGLLAVYIGTIAARKFGELIKGTEEDIDSAI